MTVKKCVLKDRLDGTPVIKRPENQEYDPELALLVRKWFGEVLSPTEDLTLEYYIFRNKHFLQ